MSAIDWTTIQRALQDWVQAGSGLADDHVVWSYEGAPRPTAPYVEMTITQVAQVSHDWVTYADNPLSFGSIGVSAVDAAADTLTSVAHGRLTGDGPVHVTSTGALPGGLVALRDYWVRRVDADTVKLCDTFEKTGGKQPEGAVNPVTPVDITNSGSGSIEISQTSDTVSAGAALRRTAQGPRVVTLTLDCYGLENTGLAPVQILTDVIASIPLHIGDLDFAGIGVSDLGSGFAQGTIRQVGGARGSILEPRATVDVTVYLAAQLSDCLDFVASITVRERLKTPTGASLPEIDFEIRR